MHDTEDEESRCCDSRPASSVRDGCFPAVVLAAGLYRESCQPRANLAHDSGSDHERLPREARPVRDARPWRSHLDRVPVAPHAREFAPGHVLAGRPMVARAARSDQDDVLFEVPGLGYAVVHLTWSGHRESSPSSPRTELFTSLAEWRERVEQPGHHEFSG